MGLNNLRTLKNEVICVVGSMWGGKTEKIIQIVTDICDVCETCILSPAINTRDSSRDLANKGYFPESVDFKILLREMIEKPERYDFRRYHTIAIDEVHLYSVFDQELEDLFYNFLMYLIHNTEANLILSFLTFNAHRKDRVFNIVSKIFPWATSVIHLKSTCDLSGKANEGVYNVLLEDKKGSNEVIGDNYAVVSAQEYRNSHLYGKTRRTICDRNNKYKEGKYTEKIIELRS